MPRPRKVMPEYQYHISGQARVFLDGKYYYLGQHDSPESRGRYFALLKEYNDNGQRMHADVPTHQIDQLITVAAVTGEYREHVAHRFPKGNQERNRFENLYTTLEDEYGDDPADTFGPRKLAELRELLVASGNCRSYVNRQVRAIKRIFRHAVSRELIDVSVVQRLDTLEPLRRGQTKAPEGTKVQPVDLAIVKKTATELTPVLKAMIEIQVATGMRPGELCRMRPCDIETRADGLWLYRPHGHKTQHHGKSRTIPIVGDVRITLGAYLKRDPKAFCFSPRESKAQFRAKQRAERKTKIQPSQRDRSRANPQKQPGERCTSDSYRQAITRACKRSGVKKWHPNQIRHATATAVREALGIEHSQALLGHSHLDMTQNYAQLSEAKAIEAAKAAPSIG